MSDIDASDLSNVERLLLSQAVYELGTEAWERVAALLSQHPMIGRPKNFFAAEKCRVIFCQLMDEAELDSTTSTPPKAAPLLKLAERHYVARVSELRELITAEEVKFKTLASEIDELRSNKPSDDGTDLERPRKRRRRHSTGRRSTEEETRGEQNEANAERPDIAIEQPEVVVPDPVVIDDHVRFPAGSPDEVLSTKVMEMETVAEDIQLPEDEQEEVRPLSPSATQEAPAAVTEDAGEEREEYDTRPQDTASPSARQKTESPQKSPPADFEQDISNDVTPEDEGADIDAAVSSGEVSDQIEDKNNTLEDDVVSEQRGRKRAREDSEAPEDDEAGPSSRPRRRHTTGESQPVSNKKFQNVITLLHSQISAHRYGNIFHNPIKKSEASDYHDIVKRPMDLKTIKSRIRDGLISNSMEFQRDIYLMFANAIMYNRPGSEIVGMAEEMMSSSEIQINAFRQTEGFHRG